MTVYVLPIGYRRHEDDLIRHSRDGDLLSYNERQNFAQRMMIKWADTRMATLTGIADALGVIYAGKQTHDALLFDVVIEWATQWITAPVFTVDDKVTIDRGGLENDHIKWGVEPSGLKVTDVRSDGGVEIRRTLTYTAVVRPAQIKKVES